ncbi:MAG TPA: hypothetical protein VLN47_09930 [Clostridiaceae bacterium]|nr:hypothetical protein [Clostridiaceae bacterium]
MAFLNEKLRISSPPFQSYDAGSFVIKSIIGLKALWYKGIRRGGEWWDAEDCPVLDASGNVRGKNGTEFRGKKVRKGGDKVVMYRKLRSDGGLGMVG